MKPYRIPRLGQPACWCCGGRDDCYCITPMPDEMEMEFCYICQDEDGSWLETIEP
jgi:hypothetical protein